MKNRYNILYLITVLLFSCANDDQEVFDKAPAVRITERNNELLSLLTSQTHGYKASYFTKNDEFGGFTFFMKFNEDGTVDMTSDFDTNTDVVKSSYDVRSATTTELVFTTRNHIQKVSNPEIAELRGTGFKGTSTFQYFGKEGETLLFRDVRNVNTGFLKLNPTGFTDFETESIAAVTTYLTQEANILPLSTSSVFQVLKVENTNGVSSFNFSYDAFRGFANASITLDDGSITEFSFGILFEENKLIISPALEFEGQVYEEFEFDSVDRSYVSTVNATKASIIFDSQPAFITKDYEEIITQPETFLYRVTLGTNPLTSAAHDAMIAEINSNLSGFGLEVYQYVVFTDFLNDGSCSTLLRFDANIIGDTASRYNATYCFEKGEVVDRKLVFKYVGVNPDPNNVNGGFFESRIQPLIDFLNSSEGMVFTREGSFSSTIGSFSNRAVTFTSVDDPSIRVYGLLF